MNVPSIERQGSGRSLWPFAIIGFFAAAILGFAGFIVFCQFNRSELVASDYYEQEIRYQAELDRLSRAQPLGDRVSATFLASTRRLSVVLPQEHAVAGVTGIIQLYRPSEAGLDRSFDLRLQSDGTQEIDAGQLRPGFWRVRIRWTYQGQEYVTERKLEVPA